MREEDESNIRGGETDMDLYGKNRPSYILESESWATIRKLVPDNHGGWILFKCRNGGWEWDDSICDNSCVQMMEQADKVYMSR